MDVARIGRDLTMFVGWREEVKAMQLSSARGVLLIDCHRLKATLGPIPETCLDDVCAMLLAMVRERVDAVSNLMQGAITTATRPPAALVEFVTFSQFVRSLPAVSVSAEHAVGVIDQLFTLLERHGFDVPPAQKAERSLVHATHRRFRSAVTKAVDVQGTPVPFFFYILGWCGC